MLLLDGRSSFSESRSALSALKKVFVCIRCFVVAKKGLGPVMVTKEKQLIKNHNKTLTQTDIHSTKLSIGLRKVKYPY